MSIQSACILCGNERPAEVGLGLIAWKKPLGNQRYAAIPRCKDRPACKARVEDMGEAWEVQDPEPVR